MNNIVLAGRLTRDPELKVTNSGIDVLSFIIAVNREYTKQGEERQTDFINCKAWQKTAVFINTYFNKGDGLVLNGRLESRKYVDKDGNNRTAYEVVVAKVEFPQGKKQENVSSMQMQPTVQTATTAPTVNNTPQLPIDEDLPF